MKSPRSTNKIPSLVLSTSFLLFLSLVAPTRIFAQDSSDDTVDSAQTPTQDLFSEESQAATFGERAAFLKKYCSQHRDDPQCVDVKRTGKHGKKAYCETRPFDPTCQRKSERQFEKVMNAQHLCLQDPKGKVCRRMNRRLMSRTKARGEGKRSRIGGSTRSVF